MRRPFALLLFLIGFVFFLFPGIHSGWAFFTDPGLRTGGPTKMAFRMHRSLSNRLPDYVDERIKSGVAETLNVNQISATEWPVYGAFFYLLTTEKLQTQWETDNSLASTAPVETGKEAIEASVRILLDEGHAHWVKLYWGDDYLEDANCFYRMLLLGGLSAHHELTGSTEHLEFLKTLTDDMAADFNTSPKGLLDDYPHQCFPADVIGGIAMVEKASRSLGEDRKAWAKKALVRVMEASDNKLPGYTASATSGLSITSSRGCTNGFCLPYIREFDPELAEKLYTESKERFWEEGTLTMGWREFPKETGAKDFYFDPDSGPVISDMGTSATGLGLGVARAYGDSNRAGILGLEFLASSFPLVTGRLLIPSLVGDDEHAPHFPEIVLMSQLAQTADNPTHKGPVPFIFWLITLLQLAGGFFITRWAYHLFKNRRRGSSEDRDSSQERAIPG